MTEVSIEPCACSCEKGWPAMSLFFGRYWRSVGSTATVCLLSGVARVARVAILGV